MISAMKIVGTTLAVILVLLAWGGVARSGEIHDAAKAGDVEKVRTLLKGNPDLVNAKDETSWTALHWAVAIKGNKAVVEVLLSNKADVNAKEEALGRTPLHMAAERAVVEVLLANKAKVNVRDDAENTPLHWAAQLGNKPVAEALLDNGADVNAKDIIGKTPLQWAVRKGHKEVAELLRQHGAK
jgi:ankyrin repeat protein